MLNNAIHRLNIFFIDSAEKSILTFIPRKAMYPLESVIHRYPPFKPLGPSMCYISNAPSHLQG